jgi:hypothetical protein
MIFCLSVSFYVYQFPLKSREVLLLASTVILYTLHTYIYPSISKYMFPVIWVYSCKNHS